MILGNRRRPAEAKTAGSQFVGDLLDHLDIGCLDREIAVLMRPRAKVDHPDVALANPQNVARYDVIEPQLVEFGLCDRLHADRTPGNEPRECVVALLNLAWI